MNAKALRTALFVPGSRPERFAKALASGADRVIVDFEDAVEASLKAVAREHLGNFLNLNPSARVVVRINPAEHPEHLADVAFCTAHVGVTAVMLAKAEGSQQLEHLLGCGKPIWPLIESAKGVLKVAEIAQVSNVERLAFGAIDLALDLQLSGGSPAADGLLNHARSALLLHSTSLGLAPPLDTVFANIVDVDGLQSLARNARDMGFGGLLCIHPIQVAIIHDVFAPSEAERAWAERVVTAAQCNPGAFQLDGQMVDAPVIARAQWVLGLT